MTVFEKYECSGAIYCRYCRIRELAGCCASELAFQQRHFRYLARSFWQGIDSIYACGLQLKYYAGHTSKTI